MLVFLLAGFAAVCGIAFLLVYRRHSKRGGNRTTANVSLVVGVVMLAAAAGLLLTALGV